MTRSVLIVSIVLIALVYNSYAQRTCPGGPNDIWTNCGTHCPPTCANPTPGPCILSCKPDTCQCRSGFFRRGDGRCVTQRGCKRGCNDH